MKVLNLSLDSKILDPLSGVTKRIYEYGEQCALYTVVVPADKDKRSEISDKTEVLSVGGNKFFQLIKIFFLSEHLIKKHKYEIISVQDTYYLAFLAWVLARKNSIGLEIQVHGFEKYRGLRKKIAKFVIPKANSIRTVSERLKKRLMNEYHISENNIVVVPIYTAAKIKNEKVKENNKCVVFLTVSRLVEIKNIKMQIEAIKILLKKGHNVELRIVGSGPEEEALKKQAKGNEDRILFTGWVMELEKIYTEADIFLLTSNREGWGLVIIEAASFGLPIIMTDVGCAGEIVINNENGLVIPVGDKEALVGAMEKYLDNYSLRIKHIKALQEKIKSLPSKEKTLELYKESWEKGTLHLSSSVRS